MRIMFTEQEVPVKLRWRRFCENSGCEHPTEDGPVSDTVFSKAIAAGAEHDIIEIGGFSSVDNIRARC